MPNSHKAAVMATAIAAAMPYGNTSLFRFMERIEMYANKLRERLPKYDLEGVAHQPQSAKQ